MLGFGHLNLFCGMKCPLRGGIKGDNTDLFICSKAKEKSLNYRSYWSTSLPT